MVTRMKTHHQLISVLPNQEQAALSHKSYYFSILMHFSSSPVFYPEKLNEAVSNCPVSQF